VNTNQFEQAPLTTSTAASESASETLRSVERFPAPAYAANVLVDLFEDAKRLFLDYMIEVDIAHTAMLSEQKIITRDDNLIVLCFEFDFFGKVTALQKRLRNAYAVRITYSDDSCFHNHNVMNARRDV
jgi:hypothetical protein